MIGAAPAEELPGAAHPARSAAVDEAWKAYLVGLERVRQMIYTHPAADTFEGRGGAHFLLQQIQAAAFNVAFGPDQRQPRFFENLLFDPGIYTWTSPGADYLYRKAFVDGASSYRITGKRKNSKLMLFQVMGAYWNDPISDMLNLGMYGPDAFKIEEDGSFEIIADEKPHEGNWIRLDSSRHNIVIMTREAFDDWDNEQRTELYIEPIGPAPGPKFLSDEEYIRRLQSMSRFMDYTVSQFSHLLVQNVAERGGVNDFVSSNIPQNHKHSGGNALGGFLMMKFDLEDGQALLIELEKIDARQWTMQTSDLWHQCCDYSSFQSSLNGFQARPDADGVRRIVLSREDPGVPNWLDTAGLRAGSIDFRFLMSETDPVVRCNLVSLRDLRKMLPEGTPVVTASDRAELLRARRFAALRRWGY